MSTPSDARDILKNMRARWFGLAIAALFPAVVFACGLDDSVVEPMNGPGGDGGGGVDSTVSPQDSSSGDSTVLSDGRVIPNDAGPPPETLVYANSQTDLYSFDILSGTLTDLGPFGASCNAGINLNDIAIDSSGQMYLLEQSDGIYKLAADRSCSSRSVLNMDPGTIDKVSGRNNGYPFVVALNLINNDFYTLDLSAADAGNATKINADLFVDIAGQLGIYDLACSKGGTCWAAVNLGCNPGIGSSCLYSFPDTGLAVAVSLGAIGVQPAGLAYVNQTLYSFGSDGKITKIALGVTPLATLVTTTGATAPAHWLGAASTSANP